MIQKSEYTYFFSVSAQVPLLRVYLINESPQVTSNSVEVEFQISRPVAGVRYFLRSELDRIWQNCVLFAHEYLYISLKLTETNVPHSIYIIIFCCY